MSALRPDRLSITGALLARNWGWNLLGQAAPLAAGVLALPAIVRGLGADRFGLLALAWSLISAFTVFDLGLGRAVTKFVAEALGAGRRKDVPQILWPAVATQTALAGVGALALAALAPAAVAHVLRVAPEFRGEAVRALQVVAATLPVVLVALTFQGALQAAQRFDILTVVRTAASASMFLVPLAGVMLGWDLPAMLLAILIVRVLALAVVLIACDRVLGGLRPDPRRRGPALRGLLTFGAWASASAIVQFLLAPADRLVIGGELSMAALAHYAIPRELISRLGVVATGSAAMVLFPAFSALSGARDLERLRVLFGRATKYLVLVAVPGFGLVAVFAEELLGAWLGPALAAASAPALRILAAGGALQALATSLLVLLQGLGRADLTGRLHLAQAPAYLAALWWMVRLRGIEGAALVWSGRVALDVVVMLEAARRVGAWTWSDARRAAWRASLPVAVFCGAAVLIHATPAPGLRALLIGGLLLLCCWWVWARALDAGERRAIGVLLSMGRGDRS
ncbi:MAG: flippase [Armatimonadota bacterium]|nr:flippase [Armatimonadota bacterium]MDR7454358.1 flippase [Armatimonadota bacterium]MDR7455970.1 flippase [Armatimonadota bacterium]MDR7496159.1 flippase [Armatimonadota bacterium]MDR7511348.1 flippase [Armatimonadota bacterium]